MNGEVANTYLNVSRTQALTPEQKQTARNNLGLTLTDAVMISLAVKIGYGEERITHALEDAESIALYDALVSAEFWVKYLDAKQTENTTESGQ